MRNRKNLMILAIGLFILAGSTILRRFIPMNDFADGCIKGVGIGIMLLSIYRMKFKPSC